MIQSFKLEFKIPKWDLVPFTLMELADYSKTLYLMFVLPLVLSQLSKAKI